MLDKILGIHCYTSNKKKSELCQGELAYPGSSLYLGERISNSRNAKKLGPLDSL
jgi:hypothetical protein